MDDILVKSGLSLLSPHLLCPCTAAGPMAATLLLPPAPCTLTTSILPTIEPLGLFCSSDRPTADVRVPNSGPSEGRRARKRAARKSLLRQGACLACRSLIRDWGGLAGWRASAAAAGLLHTKHHQPPRGRFCFNIPYPGERPQCVRCSFNDYRLDLGITSQRTSQQHN